jgi:CxxC motif-containing protein
MKQLTCIVCPVGCHIQIDEHLKVVGNKCPRGENYAILELTDPRRTLTTTVRTFSKKTPRLPVKSAAPLPKPSIFKVLAELENIIVENDVKIGDIIIKNVCDTGIDIISTRNINFNDSKEEAYHG